LSLRDVPLDLTVSKNNHHSSHILPKNKREKRAREMVGSRKASSSTERSNYEDIRLELGRKGLHMRLPNGGRDFEGVLD